MEESEVIISKELLSEVLKVKICKIHLDKKDTSILRYEEYCKDYIGLRSINICELSDKCKEWAYEDRGIEVIDRKTIHNSYYAIISNTNNIDFLNELIEFNDENPSKYSNSRYGAIFKACEWIYTKIQGEKE